MTDPITTPEQMREAALPCLCGGKALIVRRSGTDERTGYCGSTTIRCEKCRIERTTHDKPDAQGWCIGKQDTTERAIAEWNRFVRLNEAPQPVAVTIKPLVWEDGRTRLQMDPTMMMGKGYDFDTMELTRQEGYGFGCGYIIWAINSGLGKRSWNVYGTHDGIFIQDIASEDAAKAAAQADYEARIMSAIEATPARDVRAAALREAAAAIHPEIPRDEWTAQDEAEAELAGIILDLIDKEAGHG